MTVLTFAPSLPAERADQAVPLALELVDAVRSGRRGEVQCVIDRADVPALLVVLAAMVDDSRPVSELLGWVREPSRRPARQRRRQPLKPCGTHAAYVRHVDRGEPIDPLCEAEERRYQRERTRARRAERRVAAEQATA